MQTNLFQTLTSRPPYGGREAIRSSIDALLNAKSGRVPYDFGLPDFLDSMSRDYFQKLSYMLTHKIKQSDSRIERVTCERMTGPASLGATCYHLTIMLMTSETFDLYIKADWLGRFDVSF